MLYRTYLDKFCTISRENPNINTGISPIGLLTYGDMVSRVLVHFPTDNIKEKIDSLETPDINKYRHVLRITNTSGIDLSQLHEKYFSYLGSEFKTKRASSFDLIFFLIPYMDWDNGKGFDFAYDAFNKERYSEYRVGENDLISVDGCSWNKPMNEFMWMRKDDKGHVIYASDGFPENHEGVYSTQELADEYTNILEGKGSDIIIGVQHFDVGAEDIAIDLTDIVNKMITGELENHGIGIAFSPYLEEVCSEEGSKAIFERFCGLIGPRTNTFFEPYLESVYNDTIQDDRGRFSLNKVNRLYLYTTIGGNSRNLDEVPTCTVTDDSGNPAKDANGHFLENVEVKQTTTGAYYIEFALSSNDYEEGVMLYDTWSNLKYQGVSFPDVELDVVTKNQNTYFTFGNSVDTSTPNYEPAVSGIKQDEEIRRGDVRRLVIDSVIPYSKSSGQNIENIEWRLYVYDGERQIEIVPFEPVNRTTTENYVLIDTSMLIPQKYFIDIKYTHNLQSIAHHEVLRFRIAQVLNNRYA